MLRHLQYLSVLDKILDAPIEVDDSNPPFKPKRIKPKKYSVIKRKRRVANKSKKNNRK